MIRCFPEVIRVSYPGIPPFEAEPVKIGECLFQDAGAACLHAGAGNGSFPVPFRVGEETCTEPTAGR